LGGDLDKVFGISEDLTSLKKQFIVGIKRRFILSVKTLSIWFQARGTLSSLPGLAGCAISKWQGNRM
jgi:hypothetical protein